MRTFCIMRKASTNNQLANSDDQQISKVKTTAKKAPTIFMKTSLHFFNILIKPATNEKLSR